MICSVPKRLRGILPPGRDTRILPLGLERFQGGRSNLHNIQKLPILLAGGGAGQLRGGRHIRYADETPLTNLYMALLAKLDVPVEQIGDSTGTLRHLTDI
jgi:hypothetical protein